MRDSYINKLLEFASIYPEDYNKISMWYYKNFGAGDVVIYLILVYFYHDFMKEEKKHGRKGTNKSC